MFPQPLSSFQWCWRESFPVRDPASSKFNHPPWAKAFTTKPHPPCILYTPLLKLGHFCPNIPCPLLLPCFCLLCHSPCLKYLTFRSSDNEILAQFLNPAHIQSPRSWPGPLLPTLSWPHCPDNITLTGVPLLVCFWFFFLFCYLFHTFTLPFFRNQISFLRLGATG